MIPKPSILIKMTAIRDGAASGDGAARCGAVSDMRTLLSGAALRRKSECGGRLFFAAKVRLGRLTCHTGQTKTAAPEGRPFRNLDVTGA